MHSEMVISMDISGFTLLTRGEREKKSIRGSEPKSISLWVLYSPQTGHQSDIELMLSEKTPQKNSRTDRAEKRITHPINLHISQLFFSFWTMITELSIRQDSSDQ